MDPPKTTQCLRDFFATHAGFTDDEKVNLYHFIMDAQEMDRHNVPVHFPEFQARVDAYSAIHKNAELVELEDLDLNCQYNVSISEEMPVSFWGMRTLRQAIAEQVWHQMKYAVDKGRVYYWMREQGRMRRNAQGEIEHMKRLVVLILRI